MVLIVTDSRDSVTISSNMDVRRNERQTDLTRDEKAIRCEFFLREENVFCIKIWTGAKSANLVDLEKS